MKKIFSGFVIAGFVAAMTMVSVPARPAHAGCLTGAIVGGIAGHFLGGHGVAGAAAGCAGGAYMKHRDNVQQQRQQDYRQQNDPRPFRRDYSNPNLDR